MFFTLGSTVRGCTLVATAFLAIINPASAQAPSQAQRDAIKTQCRSDYIAHCSSIQPGGEASLECLQKNMSSLSASCAGAVRAVGTPAAAPKAAEPAPAAKPRTDAPPPASKSAPPKAAAASAGQPSSAQISAIRSACSADYPKVCKGVPTGGAPALQCLETNKAKLSPGCQTAVSAASDGGSTVGAAAATGAATAAVASPQPMMLRPLRPREELLVLRSACGGDVRSLCGRVTPGEGRIAQCLASNGASLSPACREVLTPFAQR